MNANREHRNVSDYTPISLAVNGGYVNIIKLLLSRTINEFDIVQEYITSKVNINRPVFFTLQSFISY